MISKEPTTDLAPLLELIARLRAPDGCPWDRKQRLTDVRAYLIEEAHETAEAIEREDWDDIAEEMGDLLFQIAFIGRLAQEAGEPGLEVALEAVRTKMIDRHPHVFGAPEERLADAGAVREAWERRKVQKAREAGDERSLLDGIPRSLPALTATYRMTQKAAGVGFDWPDPQGVVAKIEEELEEVREALAGDDQDALREEVGDLLFTVANLARKLDMDPESALAATNRKFRQRFRAVEGGLQAEGRRLEEATLEEMETHWERAKESP
jgi:ATP diphosphatase